jgi:hypothetical protein
MYRIYILFYQIKEEKRVVNVYCSKCMMQNFYIEVPLLNGNLSDMENIFKFLVIP